MVFNVTGAFTSKKLKHRPIFNQVPINITNNAATVISSSKYNQKRQFWSWFRSRPELCSPVMIRTDDTICEPEFFAKDGTALGRNTRMKAEKFWNENFLNQRLKSYQFDRLVTGSGFLWVGTISPDQIKQVVQKTMNNWFLRDLNMQQLTKQLETKAIDEDLRTPRVLDYIPSSTVVIQHGLQEIEKYIQHFNGVQMEFKPDEVVHTPLHRTDGKVDGFTPVESLTYELLLLWSIKENMLAYFRNGGVPKKIFVLPDEIANSTNHEWLVQELMDSGQIENRHGNLVLTGNVDVKDLEPDPKDMEYKDLALYVAGNIAYALRVPVTRIPYMIGSAMAKSDAGGLAESGYWAMIESDQLVIENDLNTQVFNKLGFGIRFKKRYKLDNLRETQSWNFRVDAAIKTNDFLQNLGLKLSKKKALSLLSGNDTDINENDVENIPPQEMQNNLLNRSFMPDNQINNSEGKQFQDNVKRQAANNNPKGSNQTGF